MVLLEESFKFCFNCIYYFFKRKSFKVFNDCSIFKFTKEFCLAEIESGFECLSHQEVVTVWQVNKSSEKLMVEVFEVTSFFDHCLYKRQIPSLDSNGYPAGSEGKALDRGVWVDSEKLLQKKTPHEMWGVDIKIFQNYFWTAFFIVESGRRIL